MNRIVTEAPSSESIEARGARTRPPPNECGQLSFGMTKFALRHSWQTTDIWRYPSCRVAR